MPPSQASARLTQAHRLAQVRVSGETQRLMSVAWRLLDPLNVDGTTERWLRIARPVVQRQRGLSARLAADYYRNLRALSAPSAGELVPAVLDSISSAEIEASLVVTGPARINQATGALPFRQVVRNAQAGVARSAARMALNGGRDTVLANVQADRVSLGWTRIASGAACPFCMMLVSRGPAYRSEQTADFHAHDGCHCAAAPAFIDDELWTSQADRARDLWDAAQDEASAAGELRRGTSNDALNAFRRSLSAR